MKGDEVIEDGVVLVEGNRIRGVGRRGELAIPAGARTVDATGKTIIPGLVDVHWHGAVGDDGIVPQKNWVNYASLAFGVTTIHDPSNDTETIFAASELQRAGMIVGPRIFSTGTILYGARRRLQGRDRQPRRRARPPAAHEGGRRVLGQELQPAAPRPAPAGPRRRPRARDDGGARGRLAVPAQHDHGGRRPHRHRALDPARQRLRRRPPALGQDQGRLHPDPGRRLRRPLGRELLVRDHRRLGGRAAVEVRAARDPRPALAPPSDRAGRRVEPLPERPRRRRTPPRRRQGAARRPRPARGPGRALGDSGCSCRAA